MKKGIIQFLIVILVVGALVYAALCGVGGVIKPVREGVVLGLDLVGGSEITYEAVVPEKLSASELQSGMEVARTMLQQRLDFLGYTEASAYISGERRLVVEFPSVNDPEAAVQKLGATAVVNFVDADGKVWLSGSEIDSAAYENSPIDDSGVMRPHVVLELTEEGRQKLHEATAAIVSRTSDGTNYLAIQLDGEEISKPYVNTVLSSSSVVIEIGSAEDPVSEAKYLADIISAGRLPFELTTAKQQTIGASLYDRLLPADGSLFLHRSGLLHSPLRRCDLGFPREPEPARHRGHHPDRRYGRGRERHHLRAHQGGDPRGQDPALRRGLRL